MKEAAIQTGRTALAGIVGWPVAHSLSPRLHGTWLRLHGIDGAYLPLPVRPGDVETALRGLLASGFRGVNVTVPHKQTAFDLCDVTEPSAARAGAVNTIVFDRGRILGSNTDGAGFIRSLAAVGVPPAGPALVLGAGGAARAVAAALQDEGALVSVSSRRVDAAMSLAACLGVRVLPWEHVAAALADTALLVNATFGGMDGKPALQLDLAFAAPTLVVSDIVYSPRETPLLAAARARGLRTVEGIDMLLHQAVLGFKAWFDVEPVVDQALRDYVLARSCASSD